MSKKRLLSTFHFLKKKSDGTAQKIIDVKNIPHQTNIFFHNKEEHTVTITPINGKLVPGDFQPIVIDFISQKAFKSVKVGDPYILMDHQKNVIGFGSIFSN